MLRFASVGVCCATKTILPWMDTKYCNIRNFFMLEIHMHIRITCVEISGIILPMLGNFLYERTILSCVSHQNVTYNGKNENEPIYTYIQDILCKPCIELDRFPLDRVSVDVMRHQLRSYSRRICEN